MIATDKSGSVMYDLGKDKERKPDYPGKAENDQAVKDRIEEVQQCKYDLAKEKEKERNCNHMYAISTRNKLIHKNNLKSELARFAVSKTNGDKEIFRIKGGKNVLCALVIAGTWMLFDFCPFCGQRIDWDRIQRELDEDFKEAKRQKTKKALTKRT